MTLFILFITLAFLCAWIRLAEVVQFTLTDGQVPFISKSIDKFVRNLGLMFIIAGTIAAFLDELFINLI